MTRLISIKSGSAVQALFPSCIRCASVFHPSILDRGDTSFRAPLAPSRSREIDPEQSRLPPTACEVLKGENDETEFEFAAFDIQLSNRTNRSRLVNKRHAGQFPIFDIKFLQRHSSDVRSTMWPTIFGAGGLGGHIASVLEAFVRPLCKPMVGRHRSTHCLIPLRARLGILNQKHDGVTKKYHIAILEKQTSYSYLLL